MTLYTALVTICKCAAPMIPFMTEEIYLNLVKSIDEGAPESIHLCDFPVADEKMIDKQLEEDMEEVLKTVVMGRAARNAANIKNRQPIGTMFVKAEHGLSDFYQEIIKDELNVKKIVFSDDVSAFTSYSFKPQLKTVGPKFGKQLGGIREYLSAVDGMKAMEELKAQGALRFEVNGVEIALAEEDLLIETAQKEGISVAVIHIPTVKPLNEDAVKNLAEGKKGVVVCEEANIRGGLNMLVSYILRGTGIPVESMAVMDVFGQSGSSHQELLAYYELDAENILKKIRRAAGKS